MTEQKNEIPLLETDHLKKYIPVEKKVNRQKYAGTFLTASDGTDIRNHYV